MRSLLPLLLVVALHPDTALCQGSSSPLARADIAASIGSFSAKRADASEYNQWTHSLVGSVGGGYYWSDHLKTEIDVAVGRPGGSLRLRAGRRCRNRHSRAFFWNTPIKASPSRSDSRTSSVETRSFIPSSARALTSSAGVTRPSVQRSRSPIYTRNPLNPQIISVTGQISIPALTRTETTVTVSPYAAAGFKAYFTERGFFRTDLKVSLRSGVDRVTWRAGFGADF